MGEGIKYCRNCGKQLNKTAKFCKYCGYQLMAVQEKSSFIPENRIIAAKNPGEFDYGDIDLKSIARAEVGKAASKAMAGTPVMEILSPIKVLAASIGGFLRGIVNLVRNPKSAIIPFVFAVIWIVLAFLRDSGLLPVRILSWLTFAEGGLDRGSIVGMIGGILGKSVVVTMFASLFSGGAVSFLRGLKDIFNGKGEKRGVLTIIIGLVTGVLLYFAFSGFGTASAGTSMAGIAGAILSVEAVGGSGGMIGSLAQSVTSKMQSGVRVPQHGKAVGLLTGMSLGFLIVAFIMSFV